MIGIENKDSSFFTIESPDVELQEEDFEENLLSLSITEKMSAIPQGTLALYDPTHFSSRVLRTGVRLIISWGYRTLDFTPDSLLSEKLNFDEVRGSIVRRGLQGFVSSPTGGGSSGGVVTFNCNFTAFGFRGTEESKLYTTGTKRTVVEKAFNDLGIVKRIIDFTLGSDAITPDKYYRQDESTYAFLNRLAIEWGALFHVTFDQSGSPVGIFIDPNKVGSVPLQAFALSAIGTSNILGYNGELSNVKSYKWSSSESERGVGDNVRADIVDGKIIFRRYVADDERVITYRLDQAKIQKEFSDTSSGLFQRLKKANELLSKNDFEQVKHFFIPIEQSTAPSGYGYRIKADMIGNPLFIPGNLAVISNGFPDRLGGSQSKWYIQSVDHTIDSSGYNMSVEIVDVFNLSPVGLPVIKT